MKIIPLYIIILFSLLSCSKEVILPVPPEEIFEKYKGSVVLIACQYYYEVQTDGVTYYYSPSTETKLFASRDEVLANLSFSTGTGFIISEDGKIITNNHVVNHKDENYKTELSRLFENLKSSIINDIRTYNDTINAIAAEYNDSYGRDLEYYDIERLKSKYQTIENEKLNLSNTYNRIENINLNNSISRLVIHKLGIAYNDTHVEDFEDLQECVVIKTSEIQSIDLALIQTKTKVFNKNPEYIFNFEDNNPNLIESSELIKERNIKNPIKVNEDVFMIGFNKGFALANTKQGIKSQFTSGKISQESDGERILYTIPTLEGSSGSPIVDKWGNLVGVNFAKIENSQSFSFGVPVNEVKKFYEE